ncbi:hypothetical protein Cva_00835 [Caedimonas varicaedens]|uniref:Uncharacterized protein n=1 Tax=Caedimonas varicaedens TaxID=1629334 RepID=A0A0K8MCJ2_9PROT|nr:hypothetical protein Cva_00835 [Caedimonas varicaedens]
MKILLTANEVMQRRPWWTSDALQKCVEAEDRKSPMASFAKRPHFIYDMAKVIEAEKSPTFITYTRGKGREQ